MVSTTARDVVSGFSGVQYELALRFTGHPDRQGDETCELIRSGLYVASRSRRAFSSPSSSNWVRSVHPEPTLWLLNHSPAGYDPQRRVTLWARFWWAWPHPSEEALIICQLQITNSFFETQIAYYTTLFDKNCQ